MALSHSKKLLAKRKELGLTQEEMADFIGVNVSNYSRWERGITYPSMEDFLKIRKKTGLNIKRKAQEYRKKPKKKIKIPFREPKNPPKWEIGKLLLDQRRKKNLTAPVAAKKYHVTYSRWKSFESLQYPNLNEKEIEIISDFTGKEKEYIRALSQPKSWRYNKGKWKEMLALMDEGKLEDAAKIGQEYFWRKESNR